MHCWTALSQACSSTKLFVCSTNSTLLAAYSMHQQQHNTVTKPPLHCVAKNGSICNWLLLCYSSSNYNIFGNSEWWDLAYTSICLSILMRQQEKHFPTQQHSLQYSFSSENCNTAVTCVLMHLQSCKIIGKLSKNRIVFLMCKFSCAVSSWKIANHV